MKQNLISTFIITMLIGMLIPGPLPAHASVHSKKLQKLMKEIHDSENRSADRNTDLTLVTGMRHWSNPDYTRISVTLDREAAFEYHQLKKNAEAKLPPRIYIDIKGARIAGGVKDMPIGDGLLRMARIAQYRADIVRVVLDIDNIKDFKIFSLSDPFRIIVDVKGEREQEITGVDQSISALPAQQHEEPQVHKNEEMHKSEEVRNKSSIFRPGKIRRIVIDPGHGGHDPGAMNADGTCEKDVVLDIARKLADRIRKDLGIDVIMTRSTDVFIPLEERTAIANKVNADLFVSIHANASLNKYTSGIETYYLNLAKSEKAARVAARENNTSLDKVNLLQATLFDLMANSKINDSARLADDVQKSLFRKIDKDFRGARNLGVKQGPFYVLLGATMPSILVETAFVSNATEAARLKNPDYQDATVEGIEEGIRAYISDLR
jgi:N-acetylmuramoyl-L-alanine amidase